MKNQLQTMFDEVNKTLLEERIIDCYEVLIELYNNMTCNCFLRSQDNLVYQNQLEFISLIEDDSLSYELNLIKGFVNLRNENIEEGYKYLTKSIEIRMRYDGSSELKV